MEVARSIVQMAEPRSVLIAGASIAGPALAFWLKRYHFRPVVVERADQLRLGGQNIDIRGAARTVVRRMGLEQVIRARTTGEKGVRFVDDENTTKAELPAGTADSGGLTAEVEILRGDLASILYDHTHDEVEYIFGDSIAALDEREAGVTVSFVHGADRVFDHVIAADGIRSRTRSLIVDGEAEVRSLGLGMAYFTIPHGGSDDSWARWFNAPRGRVALLRPDNVGTTRALLSFLAPPPGSERWNVEEQKDLLHHVFADVGWEVPRMLDGLARSTDMYFESIGQVFAPRWSRGRNALVGDAAHCPSPISGMGTSLALVGAYVLAGELASHANHRAAFAAYEATMRPYVRKAQTLWPGAPRLAYPKSKLGIALFHAGVRIGCSRPFRRGFGSPPSDEIDLPDYSRLSDAVGSEPPVILPTRPGLVT